MRWILWVGMGLLLMPCVSGLEVTDYKVIAEIENNVLRENVTLTITNTLDSALEELSYPFAENIREVGAFDGDGALVSKVDYRKGRTYVSCEFREPVYPGEQVTVTFTYLNPGAITTVGESYLLSTTYSLLANVKNFRIVLMLSEGYGISEEGVSIVPTPDEISSDGRRVIVVWDMRDPIPTEFREFRLFVRYERLVKDYTSYIVPGAAGVILLGLAFAILGYKAYSNRRDGEEKEENNGITSKIDILKEDEQRILRMVIEENGIKQRKIQDETGFSKAKVSKIISELEKRGAIIKEQIGRKNRIYLSDKLKET